MPKSIPAILGLGVAACVLLSFMMKGLVEHRTDAPESPYAPAIETRLGSRLVGPVRIDERRNDGRLQLVVRARVLAGLDKRRLADTIGRELWLGARRAGQLVNEVLVVIDDDAGGGAIEVGVLPPGGR